MKGIWILLGVIVIVIFAGIGLFFFGPPQIRALVTGNPNPTVPITLLKEGQDATAMTDRANYRIQNGTQLNQLWGYLAATPDSVPNIDFTKQDVLAVFDGTHTTGGYMITVTSVTDANGTRTVNVLRTSPGANCSTVPAITAPYEIIAVPKSALPLTHIDSNVTQSC